MSENPFTDGQQFSAARLNSMYSAHQNEGVLNGCDGSTSTNAFDVDVLSGNVFLNGTNVSVGATTVSHSTSDPEDRIDLLSVDSTGAVNITQGNPAATAGQPVAPDIPTDEILISLVYVRGGSSEILTGDIFNDYKVTLATDIPAFESPQGDFTDATVANPPSNPTDVVRQTELVSGNPHADSAAVSDLPVVQTVSVSDNVGSGVSNTTYASFNFTEAYVLAYQITADDDADDSGGDDVTSRISTNNWGAAVNASFLEVNTETGSGKDYARTTTVEFQKSSESGAFGSVSGSASILVIEP